MSEGFLVLMSEWFLVLLSEWFLVPMSEWFLVPMFVGFLVLLSEWFLVPMSEGFLVLMSSFLFIYSNCSLLFSRLILFPCHLNKWSTGGHHNYNWSQVGITITFGPGV